MTVNLAVEAVAAQGTQSGWHDVVAVSATGPGQMPLASVGPHTGSVALAASTPFLSVYNPSYVPNQDNYNLWTYPNWELLAQFDWTDGAGPTAPPPPPAPTPPPGSPQPQPPVSPRRLEHPAPPRCRAALSSRRRSPRRRRRPRAA